MLPSFSNRMMECSQWLLESDRFLAYITTLLLWEPRVTSSYVDSMFVVGVISLVKSIHYIAGLTKSSARGVRSTLQNPLGSKISLSGSPGGSLKNLEEILKIITQFQTNNCHRLQDYLVKCILISEHLLNKLLFALKCS